jgi:hypothetical protein
LTAIPATTMLLAAVETADAAFESAANIFPIDLDIENLRSFFPRFARTSPRDCLPSIHLVQQLAAR